MTPPLDKSLMASVKQCHVSEPIGDAVGRVPRLRRAVPSDADALCRLHLASWRRGFRDFVSRAVLDRLPAEDFLEGWRRLLSHGRRGVLVVEEASRIRAFCVFGRADDDDVAPTITGEIHGLFVAPRSWRRGYGRALCEKACTLIVGRGLREVVLWVLVANSRARAFYERLGFSPDSGATRPYRRYGLDLPEMRYRRTLAVDAR